jgi:hypothetical protein
MRAANRFFDANVLLRVPSADKQEICVTAKADVIRRNSVGDDGRTPRTD